MTFVLYIYTEWSHISFPIQSTNKACNPNNQPSAAWAFTIAASQIKESIR